MATQLRTKALALLGAGAGLLALASLAAPPAHAAARPNVILIMADDQGYGDLACHGNPVIQTPHMDGLHAQSARLTDFHVAPMCSPTRGQLLTGRDAMKTGCTAVCRGRSMPRADIPTLADYFVRAGYATGHFGKWHLGDSYPFRPQDRGFQETLHHRAWGITSLADYWGNTYFSPMLNRNGVDTRYEGYCTDIFFDAAMSWMAKRHQRDEPFFVYLPTNTPHVPNVCADRYSQPYEGEHAGKPLPPKFYGMIANLDENLGRLEAFLDRQRLRDNTLLIYLSDNGTQSERAMTLFNAGMRDRKTSVFEGGHRVPCFVRWPDGGVVQGADIDALTQVQDLLPTIAELARLDTRGADLDGQSLAPLLRGADAEPPARKLVIQYGFSCGPWDSAVVLWNRWRLVGPRELYNVDADPHQDRNVAAEHPEIVREMREHYEAWYAESRPLYDTPRWIRVGAEGENPMRLYAQDWVGDYCDNRGGLMQATGVGYWDIEVERAGAYEFELRRWPFEADLPLSAGVGPAGDEGRRPIAAASLRVGGVAETLETLPDDTHVVFRGTLDVGKQRLQTRFLDAAQQTLCSAMYVRVERLSDRGSAEITPAHDAEAVLGTTQP
ncbi:MAG: arylsulfatase [Planctomycetota bacterium]